MTRLAILAAVLALSVPAPAAEQTLRAPGVVVQSSGISEAYAKAIGQTTSAAREAAAALGFDMPETIRVDVRCQADARVRLFNDGKDYFRLTVRSEKDLRKPAVTGIFHLYGLCHEVGHLAMYRPIRQREWLTGEAKEGWAHYLGSRLVDAVYEREGPTLWPDRYDYRADGMARLKRQTEGARPADKPSGAALWMELAGLVGEDGIAPVFKAWGQAKIAPADPAPVAGNMLKLAGRGNPKLDAWWQRAVPVLIDKLEGSAFEVKTVSPRALSGKPVELKQDDGQVAGRNSMAGSGHAVRFEVSEGEWYLRGVMVHGTRYGGSRPPDENFHVWLCDTDFRPVADFPFPYAAFKRGDAAWVPLPIKQPTLVPRQFIVCVGFNPTASKGVFVSRDKAGSSNTLVGLPGKGSSSFGAGDWMIRAVVDQPKP